MRAARRGSVAHASRFSVSVIIRVRNVEDLVDLGGVEEVARALRGQLRVVVQDDRRSQRDVPPTALARQHRERADTLARRGCLARPVRRIDERHEVRAGHRQEQVRPEERRRHRLVARASAAPRRVGSRPARAAKTRPARLARSPSERARCRRPAAAPSLHACRGGRPCLRRPRPSRSPVSSKSLLGVGRRARTPRSISQRSPSSHATRSCPSTSTDGTGSGDSRRGAFGAAETAAGPRDVPLRAARRGTGSPSTRLLRRRARRTSARAQARRIASGMRSFATTAGRDKAHIPRTARRRRRLALRRRSWRSKSRLVRRGQFTCAARSFWKKSSIVVAHVVATLDALPAHADGPDQPVADVDRRDETLPPCRPVRVGGRAPRRPAERGARAAARREGSHAAADTPPGRVPPGSDTPPSTRSTAGINVRNASPTGIDSVAHARRERRERVDEYAVGHGTKRPLLAATSLKRPRKAGSCRGACASRVRAGAGGPARWARRRFRTASRMVSRARLRSRKGRSASSVMSRVNMRLVARMRKRPIGNRARASLTHVRARFMDLRDSRDPARRQEERPMAGSTRRSTAATAAAWTRFMSSGSRRA